MAQESMPLDTHDHPHTGVYAMTWENFGSLCRELAMRIWQEYQPDVVVAIAKAGLLVGVCLSSAMRRDLFPIKLSSRHNEEIVRDEPRWFVRPTPDLAGKRVLLVDDMAVSMTSLTMARDAILAQGAAEVRTATLMVHGISQRPDWYALETDALILVPWDARVIEGDRWIVHPEFQAELDVLGMSMPDEL